MGAAGFIDQTTAQLAVPRLITIHDTRSNLENKALFVSNSGATDWTDGDGTVQITISYTVVTL